MKNNSIIRNVVVAMRRRESAAFVCRHGSTGQRVCVLANNTRERGRMGKKFFFAQLKYSLSFHLIVETRRNNAGLATFIPKYVRQKLGYVHYTGC